MCNHIDFYTLKHIATIIAHWYELYFQFINIQTPTCYHDSEHQMKNVSLVPYTHKPKVGPISNHNNVQMNRYFSVVSCNDPIFIYKYIYIFATTTFLVNFTNVSFKDLVVSQLPMFFRNVLHLKHNEKVLQACKIHHHPFLDNKWQTKLKWTNFLYFLCEILEIIKSNI